MARMKANTELKRRYLQQVKDAKAAGEKPLSFAAYIHQSEDIKDYKEPKYTPPKKYGQRSGRVSISDRRRASGKAYEEATGRRSPYKRK